MGNHLYFAPNMLRNVGVLDIGVSPPSFFTVSIPAVSIPSPPPDDPNKIVPLYNAATTVGAKVYFAPNQCNNIGQMTMIPGPNTVPLHPNLELGTYKVCYKPTLDSGVGWGALWTLITTESFVIIDKPTFQPLDGIASLATTITIFGATDGDFVVFTDGLCSLDPQRVTDTTNSSAKQAIVLSKVRLRLE